MRARPRLLIVTGRPAAGKSTLAARLARDLGLPLVGKDAVREVLFGELGWRDREWAKRLGKTSVELMYYFAGVTLAAGASLALDNTFHPDLAAPRIRALVERYGAAPVQVVCDADSATLYARFVARAEAGTRHPGHADAEVLDELRANLAQNRPARLAIGGTVIEVDTTDFARVDYAALLETVRAALREARG